MKVYVLTQQEIDSFRDKLRLDWMEHCERYNLSPNLVNDPNHHDYDLFAKFNFTFCRWRNDVVGDTYPKDLRPDEKRVA